MRKNVLALVMMMSGAVCTAQELIVPEGSATFRSELRNGEMCGITERGGYVVAVSNSAMASDLGRFYCLMVEIENKTDRPCSFDPRDIEATKYDEDGSVEELEVYSPKKYMRLTAFVHELTSGEPTDKLVNRAIDGDLLKATTIGAGESARGMVYVKRKNSEEMMVVVPVEDEEYTFRWKVSREARKRSRE